MTEQHTIAATSRLWFFQSERKLQPSEVAKIDERLEHFFGQWTSHGAQMMAKHIVLHDALVVVALDETQAAASGCGVDKCFREITALAAELGVDLMSRNTVVYSHEGETKLTKLNQFWAMKKAGIIHKETLVVDTTIAQWGDLGPGGWRRFEETWHMEMWSH